MVTHGSDDFIGLEHVRALFSCSHTQQEKQEKPLLYSPGSARNHDWSNLPRDILTLIADKLNFTPHLQLFGAACKEWCIIITEKNRASVTNPKAPLLLLPYNEQTKTCTFMEINTSKKYDLNMPLLKGRWIRCSSNGWLALNDKTLILSLFNPFTRAEIKFPHPIPIIDKLRTNPSIHIRKVVLSGDPSCPNCVVVVIFSDYARLATCRLGDKNGWNVATSGALSYVSDLYKQYEDVVFYQGKLFAVQTHKRIMVFNYSEQKGDLSYERTIEKPWQDPEWVVTKKYLVQSGGQLFYISRFIRVKRDVRVDKPQKTWLFEVYVLKPDGKSWSRVKDLGDRSLFLGPNDSLFASAEDFSWCKPNCIYFTQHSSNRFGFQWDNGVYSLERNRVVEIFDIEHSLSSWPTPALWYLPKD